MLNAENIRKIRSGLESGTLSLMVPEGTRGSKAWATFKQVVDTETKEPAYGGFVQCSKCKRLMSFSQRRTGTRGMVAHKCAQMKLAAAAAATSSKSMKAFAIVKPSKKTQAHCKAVLMKRCVELCCKDLRPFQMVKGVGFRKYSQELLNLGSEFGGLEIGKVLPSPQSISKAIVTKATQDRDAFVETLLKVINNNCCAMTTDMWTDDYKKRSYTGVTVHYINSQWQLVNKVLFTRGYPEEIGKTHDKLLQELLTMFDSIRIQPRHLANVFFVTDQGKNIVKALADYKRFNCCAHVLNTVLRNTFADKFLEDNLPEVKKTLDACKSLVGYIKRSGKNTHKNLKRGVRQEIETRWNSRLAMLESIHCQFAEIETVVEVGKRVDIDIDLVELLINLLKPFKVASDTLESNQCSLPFALMCFTDLKNQLKVDDAEDVAPITVLKSRAHAFLIEKFEITPTHKIATFLNPKFKELLAIENIDDAFEVRQDVRRRIAAFNLDRPVGTPASSLHSAASSVDSDFFLSQPSTSRGIPTTAKTVKAKPRPRFDNLISDNPLEEDFDEIEHYVNLRNIPYLEAEDILPWWKQHSSTYPGLSKLAREILCIPASSAASERNFSNAGMVVQERRTRLKPELVDSILYLHNNDDIDLEVDEADEDFASDPESDSHSVTTVEENPDVEMIDDEAMEQEDETFLQDE